MSWFNSSIEIAKEGNPLVIVVLVVVGMCSITFAIGGVDGIIRRRRRIAAFFVRCYKKFSRIFRVSKCSYCKELSWNIRTYQGKDYCDTCVRKHFLVCEECDKITKQTITVERKKICKKCFNYYTQLCLDCNKRFLTSNMIAKKNQNLRGFRYFCSDCYSKRARSFGIIRLRNLKLPSASFMKNHFKSYCGVEIECENENRDENCFIKPELKNLKFSQIKDGSLCDGMGAEFYSRPMNSDVLVDSIDEFCQELQKKDYYIDKHCGLHIHLEVEQRLKMLKKLYLFYLKFEPFFFKMLPKSRQDNEYCEKLGEYYGDSHDDIMNTKTLHDFKTMIYETCHYMGKIKDKHYHKRYCWVNLHSLFYRGTLEIRSHSGTINQNKIINWLLIHLRILEFLKEESLESIRKMKVTKQNFLKIFHNSLGRYIKSRWMLFPESSVGESKLELNKPSYWLN